jgi:type IX secretion system PorP/SprF family membrane protein
MHFMDFLYSTDPFNPLPALKRKEWFQLSFPLLVAFFFVLKVNGQDPVFSQFYLSPLQLNPGLTGLTDDARFTANYRNQFPGFNNAYKTYALSYDQYFPRRQFGLGAWLLADDAGDGILKTIKAAGIFSYRLRLNDNFYAKMGAEVGIVQSTLHWDQLLFGDQIDDYLGTVSPGGIPFPTEEVAPAKNSTVYPDLGIGGVVYGGTLYAGLAVRHLNTPRPDFLGENSGLTPGIPMRWTVHAGGSWPILRKMFSKYTQMDFAPSFIFVSQGPVNQFNGGFTLDGDLFSFGLQYRVSSGKSEAIIGSIGLRTNNLRLGYSYDATISGFEDSGGTHEIGIVYILDDGSTESRYNDCLQIFR